MFSFLPMYSFIKLCQFCYYYYYFVFVIIYLLLFKVFCFRLGLGCKRIVKKAHIRRHNTHIYNEWNVSIYNEVIFFVSAATTEYR